MEAKKNLHRLFPNLPLNEDVIQGNGEYLQI